MEGPVVLGVDIGGSHITAALVDVGKRTLIVDSIRRKLIDSQDEASAILDSWCEVIIDSFAGHHTLTKHIGISFPGPFDYDNGICLIKEQDKFQALYNCKVKEELACRLAIPTSAIHFINDAAGFLQGEVFTGVAEDANHVLGFTLGTGLGSSICVNGIAIDAALWDTPFLDGIAEDYLSTRWFVQRYFQLSGRRLAGVKELAHLAEQDENAKQVFNEFGNNFAQFTMPLIKEHRADVVILGGNISQAFPIFAPNLIDVLKKHQVNTKIKVTTLHEHAALIGAASYCSVKV